MELNIFEEIFNFVGSEVVVLSFFVGAFVYLIISMLKKYYKIKKNIIPVLAIVTGIVISLMSYVFVDLDIVLRIWGGVLGGFISISAKELFSKRYGKTNENR